MTKFINRARQTGKSTMLIHAAYMTDSPIIVYDRPRKMCLQEQANKIGCKGVEIFTLREWMELIGRHKPKTVMIDEALPKTKTAIYMTGWNDALEAAADNGPSVFRFSEVRDD